MDLHPLTAFHPLPDGEAHLVGAVRTVTGSMTRIETGGSSVLIDCGAAQGAEARDFHFPEAARSVKSVVLTHGHLDHVGSLPALLDGGFAAPIFGTRATLDITEIVVDESIRIAGGTEQDSARFKRRLRELARPVPYDTAFTPPGMDGHAWFREAGHILGSASVEIVTPRSRLVCSGDLGRPDSPILRDYCSTWGAGRPVDLVVLESTYGDRQHCHGHGDIEHELERIIRRTVSRGGHGTCTGGRVASHLQALLPHEAYCVVFAGFQAPGAPGAAIQLAGRGGSTVWLECDDVPVRASTETLHGLGLSAHAAPAVAQGDQARSVGLAGLRVWLH